MSMSTFVRGGISVFCGLLSLYILETTFGTAFDSMYLQFNLLLTKLSLGPGWAGVATNTLGGWVWFDRAFVVCVIALFVWLVSTLFVDIDYGRRAPPGQY